MKKLIIAALLAASMTTNADTNADIQRLVSLTSELSDFCINLIPTKTVNNKACKQMLVNMRTLKSIDNETFLLAVDNSKTRSEIDNIIHNARSLKVVYKSY